MSIESLEKAASSGLGFKSRTLLTNVLGFSEILADPTMVLLPRQRLEYAEIIAASAAALRAEERRFISIAEDIAL